MAALVFEINATPAQANDAQALSNNSTSIVPSTAGAKQGITAPVKDVSKITNTTGVLIAGYTIKQAAGLITSNVGRLTGNSHLQNQVNNAMKLGATAVGLFTHPIMTSLALAVDGINYGINSYFTERDDKIRASQAQAIAGTLRGRKN